MNGFRVLDEASLMLDELKQFVYYAAVYWESYLIMRSLKSDKEYKSIVDYNNWWYEVTKESYLLSSINAIHKFHEKNKRSINIFELIRILGDDYSLQKNLIEGIINSNCHISKAIVFCRNNYYSHSSKKLSFESVMARASIGLAEVSNLIRSMENILNVLIQSFGSEKLNIDSIVQRSRSEMHKAITSFK